MTFAVATSDFFVNAPFKQLEDSLLELLISHGLQPEIGLEGNCLYTTSREEFKRVAGKLAENGLGCTLHAPFFDLEPGALDPHIRQATRNKLRLAFALIPLFKPKAIICHLGYVANRHGYKQQEWFRYARETWEELLALAAPFQTVLMLENTYETSPEQHHLMLEALDSPLARFCFDAGHVQAFAGTDWQHWQSIVDARLGHLHLHDNCGDRDAHLAVGRGHFDFAGFFAHLAAHDLHPTMTIEPHSEDDLWASLAALRAMGVLQGPINHTPY